MNRLEITNQISQYLTKHPLSLIDLLGTTIKLNNYEKYVQELALIKKTYDKEIPQYTSEASKYLEKMDAFIEECLNSEHPDNYINNYLRTRICSSNYNNQITPQFVCPNSLSGNPEQSIYALKQIYTELGEEQLDFYVQLIKNPGELSSSLSNPKKQKAAMHYILWATNHHSSTKLKRNKSAQTLYALTNSSIQESINEISKQKEDYISFMNQEKENYLTWFNSTNEETTKFLELKRQNYDQIIKDSEDRLNNLEQTYSEKLKVEKPAEYMQEKSNEYKKQSASWAKRTIGLSVLLMMLLGFILDPKIEISKNVFSLQIFSGNMTIYNQIIVLALITLVVYLLKLFVKMTISTKHLAEEYYQKHVLTYFYLSLVKEGSIKKEQADMVLGTLFTKADTGLIKNDSSGEVETLQKILLSMKSPS